MTPESNLARAQLAAAGRKRDRTARFATGISIGASMVLLFVVVALVDYWVLLSVPARWLTILTLVALFLTGVVKVAQLGRRKTSLKDAALELEATQPRLGCEVSTAAEYLSGERKITQEYERDLVAALEIKASTTLGQTSVPYQRRLYLPAVATGVGVLGLLGFVATFPSAATALKRTAAPWLVSTFTQVEVRPGSVEIPVGGELEFAPIFHGRRPKMPRVQLLEEGQANWANLPLVDATNGSFRHTLTNIRTSFTYRVTGSDAISETYKVTAYIPPAVKELSLRLAPPEYTHLKASVQTSADVSAVRGTTAAIQLTPTVPLSRAFLRFTNNTELELIPDAEQRWNLQLPIVQDGGYRIELVDAKGRRSIDGPVYHIAAIPDAPPKVEITEPGGDLRAAATDKIPLKLSATDDFGVAEVRVVYHRLGDPEQSAIIRRSAGAGADFKGEFELELAGLKLNDYELVAYHAEAKDHNTLDGPGVGRSPVYFIEITNLEGKSGKKPGKPGEKVNLLMVEKQIIADTTALAKNDPGQKFAELAARQMDAVAFAQMYQSALAQSGAPFPVQGEMAVAVQAMKSAGATLEKRQREGALPPEEAALASLYRVMQLMPQLKDLPIVPPAEPKPPGEELPPTLKVVLEAIQKRKPEDPSRAEFARALEQIQQLSRQQSSLSTACQNPGSSPSDGSAGVPPAISRPTPSLAKANSAAKNANPGKPNPGSGKPSDQPGGKPGEKAEANPEEKSGQAKAGGKKGSPGEEQKNSAAEEQARAQELAKLAPQQEKLSKEAQEIAERLARLAGKASRQGAKAGQQMGEAAGKMAVAAKAMKGGDRPAAGSASDQGSAAMSSAMALLESLLQGKPELSDVVAEEAPAQYESAISDYFRRLSHAQ